MSIMDTEYSSGENLPHSMIYSHSTRFSALDIAEYQGDGVSSKPTSTHTTITLSEKLQAFL